MARISFGSCRSIDMPLHSQVRCGGRRDGIGIPITEITPTAPFWMKGIGERIIERGRRSPRGASHRRSVLPAEGKFEASFGSRDDIIEVPRQAHDSVGVIFTPETPRHVVEHQR